MHWKVIVYSYSKSLSFLTIFSYLSVSGKGLQGLHRAGDSLTFVCRVCFKIIFNVSHARYRKYADNAQLVHTRVVRKINEKQFLAPKKVEIVAFLHEYLILYGDEQPSRNGKTIWQLPSHMSMKYIYDGYLREVYDVGRPIRYRYSPEMDDSPRSKPLVDTSNKSGAFFFLFL
jgi:hypothetical protein